MDDTRQCQCQNASYAARIVQFAHRSVFNWEDELMSMDSSLMRKCGAWGEGIATSEEINYVTESPDFAGDRFQIGIALPKKNSV